MPFFGKDDQVKQRRDADDEDYYEGYDDNDEDDNDEDENDEDDNDDYEKTSCSLISRMAFSMSLHSNGS